MLRLCHGSPSDPSMEDLFACIPAFLFSIYSDLFSITEYYLINQNQIKSTGFFHQSKSVKVLISLALPRTQS